MIELSAIRGIQSGKDNIRQKLKNNLQTSNIKIKAKNLKKITNIDHPILKQVQVLRVKFFLNFFALILCRCRTDFCDLKGRFVCLLWG